MTKPSISVLTSCFNGAEFLEESIESILGQSFRDFEYILIDDGSSDDTPTILRRYAGRDRRIIVISKENSGLTNSLNVGLGIAQGEWIARLDADDIAMPGRLESQLIFVRKRSEVIAVGSGSIEIDKNGRFIKRQSFPANHHDLVKNLEHLWRFFAHSSAFFSRKQALELGGYRQRLNLVEDWDLWLRMGSAGQIACIREPLVKTRLHLMSICHQNRRVQAIMGLAATICHLRRKAGLSDPSLMSQEKWLQFLNWVAQRQDEEGYARKAELRQTLRNIWFVNRETSLMRKSMQSIDHLRKSPYSLSVIKEKFCGSNAAFKLAYESADWTRIPH
jgi:hypothetical protein